MTSSQLSYLRLANPFAEKAKLSTAANAATVKSVSDTLAAGANSANPAIYLSYGIAERYAFSGSNISTREGNKRGELVPRSLFNVLMHFVTRIHFALQCGMLFQNRTKSGRTDNNDPMFPTLTQLTESPDGVSLKDTPNTNANFAFPDNAIAPMVGRDGRVAYYKYKTGDKCWHPFAYMKVLPDNVDLTNYTNATSTFTAGENCWMYIRSICIPSFSISVNKQKITIHTKNQESTLRYHGAVAHFDTLLLKKGDVVEFPNSSDTMRISYMTTPCVLD